MAVYLTWHHIPESYCAESDEGVIKAIVKVPGAILIILQRRKDRRRDEHQDRGEEEDKHACLHDDDDNLWPVLRVLPTAETLPEFFLILLKLNKHNK